MMPLVKPDNCHNCLTRLALVVFPFVPVIPTAVNELKGESLNQAASAPTICLGFSRLKIGNSEVRIRSDRTATAPFLIAISKKSKP